MPKPSSSKNNSKQYAKYAGLATSMFFGMYIMFWLGSKIDAYIGNEIQYIGLTFVILTLFSIFYKLIKELS